MTAGPGAREAVPGQDAHGAGERLQRVAEEQAALRRIAVQVARAAAPDEVFAAVTEEVHRLLDTDLTTMCRFNPDGTLTVVGVRVSPGIDFPAHAGDPGAVGGRNVLTLVFHTGRPARIDDMGQDAAAPLSPGAGQEARAMAKGVAAALAAGVRSSVAVPVNVAGRLWGAMSVGAGHGRVLPADTEERLAGFTELVAVAVAGAEAREELRRVADEQAALRRVATLVARGQPPAAVFAAVADEVAALFSADSAGVVRFEPDGQVTRMGGHGWGARWGSEPRGPLPAGTLVAVVRETGRAARFDVTDPPLPGVPDLASSGFRSVVDVPVVVDGRLWGAIGAGSQGARLPPDTGERLAGFTELMATAIANAEAQAELTASRARIVATADRARRRFERDLHDGAQQSLVSLALQVRAARAAPPDGDDLERWLDEMATALDGVLEEVREIARGLHPAVLASGGLRPALHALARRSAVPVRLEVRVAGRLPEQIEIAAYYVVAEALTNAAKHARASAVSVEVEVAGDALRVVVRDDGTGGADLTPGAGLVGLKDRVEAQGGRFLLDSPRGAGTSVHVEFPLAVRLP